MEMEAPFDGLLFEIILVSRRPSFSDEGTFFVRVRDKTMETLDWRPRKLRFQQTEKKTLGVPVLVVTAVTKQ